MAYFKHLFIIHSSFVFSFKKYVFQMLCVELWWRQRNKKLFPTIIKEDFLKYPLLLVCGIPSMLDTRVDHFLTLSLYV